MSRKQQLKETLSKYLEYDKQGSLKSRQHRHFILNKIINDFYNAKVAPANWYVISQDDIKTLVMFWKEKDVKDSTIMNHLVCLRHFLKNIDHSIEGIDNQSLELRKPRNDIKPEIDSDEVLNAIQEPIAYLLFALQAQFGLSLLEAMHLIPSVHIQDSELWITREISTNHTDRFVPIITQLQHAIIEKLHLIAQQQSLAQKFGEKHLRLSWKFALSGLNLPTHINYHYLYAKARFAALQPELGKVCSKKKIISEMSLNRTSPIWTAIHE